MENNRSVSPVIEDIWRFVRGDMPTADFERWAYSAPNLERLLGSELYLAVIATDYSSKDSVFCIKRELLEFVRSVSDSACTCIQLGNTAVVDMGEDSFKVFLTLDQVRDRGQPYWWLSVYQCRVCQQWWLVAQEERQNDVFCLHRLTAETAEDLLENDHWPPVFDTYESLLRLGIEAGKRVRFLDPMNSRSLRWTVSDLAKERPGIGISKIAELLNLEDETATAIARQVVQEDGVDINFGDAG